MTTVAVMQPTVWPWLGYLDMLDQADLFILLDTVPLNTKSWQTRNRIRGRDGQPVWLSVPNHGRRDQPLNTVPLANEHPWQAKHSRILQAAYQHAPHWPVLRRLVDRVYMQGWRLLADLTADMISSTARLLEISTPILRAGSLPPTRPGRVERIIDLCRHVDADTLLDTPGALFLQHLHELEPGIALDWHMYKHPPYPHGHLDCMPYLSVLDCLAWHGDDTPAIIRSGRPETRGA